MVRAAEPASAKEGIYLADLRSVDRTFSGAKSQTHEAHRGKVPINPAQCRSPPALKSARRSQVVFPPRWPIESMPEHAYGRAMDGAVFCVEERSSKNDTYSKLVN